jgi:hypothetical protein
VLSGIDAASNTSGREKSRAVAASLAERDQERLRAMTYEQIQKVNPTDATTQQPDTVVDNVTYKIKSEVNLVTDDIGGTPECGDEGTQVTYVHITSTVTSKLIGNGKPLPEVKVDSLIPPTQKWAEGHGTLGVKVVDRSATQGVRNILVAATSSAFTPTSQTTDQNGCVVFKDVPIGTYTITLNTPNYLDRELNQQSQTTATVVAKKVVFATMSYDVADTIEVSVKTHTPGKTWAAAGTSQQQPSKARKVSTINGANVGMLRTVAPGSPASTMEMNGLFPFAENSYAFFSGGCRYLSPDQVATTSSATKLWPNYFSTTGGVNPAAAVLADPAIAYQPAAVRQPPFNIRVGATRNGAAFSDANMMVYVTLQKPSGTSTDSCTEARWDMVTTNWDSARFGTRVATNGGGNDHWVSQSGGTFDPGMPFGTYTICLRDTNLNRSVNIGNYPNYNPDGGPLWQVGNNSVNRDGTNGSISWSSGNIC